MVANDKNNNSLLVKFLKSFVISAVTLAIIVGIVTAAYVYLNKGKPGNSNTDPENPPTVQNPEEPDTEEPITEESEFTTFLVYGVDQEGIRTDVVMLVVFNAKTNTLDVVSVPRDTRIELPDKIYSDLKERRDDVPKIMKINAIPAYSYPDRRNETSVQVFEEVFGMDVDYYVNIDLKGFRNIVDLIGGVEMYIPDDLKYSDPVQDLYINIKKGQQTLNGDKAEQLIRYRKGYENGDLGRIDMQHEFMKAFMDKLLTDKNKLNMLNIATNILLYVETNFTEGLDYIQFLDTFTSDKIEMHRIPGDSKWINKISYFIYDEEKTAELIDSLYTVEEPITDQNETNDNNTTDEDEDETVEKPIEIDSKTLNIEILNSTQTINGFAADTKDKFVNDGFDTSKIVVGNYKEEILKKTKIIVGEKGAGVDLMKYFKDPELIVDPTQLRENVHIKIILGTDDGE